MADSREDDKLLIENVSLENMPPAGICNEVGMAGWESGIEGEREREGEEVFVYPVIDLLSERLRLYRDSHGSTPGKVLLKTNLVH